MTDNNGFIKGTVILGVSGIVVKILSAMYRIPLTRMIGAEGMGQYTAAFNFFMPFFSLATAGITPALSRMCAGGNYSDADIRAIKNRACVCFGLSSATLAATAFVFSRVYSEYTGLPMVFTGVALLLPNLIFATFEAVYKGISQGTMNMAVTAKAGILESTVKTVTGICGVYLAGVMLSRHRAQGQLIWAFFTVSFSGMVCFIYMHRDFKTRYRSAGKGKSAIKPTVFLSMAVPISLSALVVSLSNFCDTVVCLSIIKTFSDSRLAAAYPFIAFSAVEEKAVWLFGVYQGLCLSVVNLIPSMSAAVGASSLPVITRAVEGGNGTDTVKRIDRIVNLTAVVVVPVSLYVAFFPSEVIMTLYGDNGAQTELAACFLRFMAPAAIFAAFSFPLNSIMHASGKSTLILKILCFSCCVKVGLSLWLCSMEKVNVMGCIVSQMVFHIIVFILSVYTVKNVYPPENILRRIVYPAMLSYILLSFVRAVAELLLYNVPVVFRTFFCGGIFMGIYLCILVLTGFFVDKNKGKW